MIVRMVIFCIQLTFYLLAQRMGNKVSFVKKVIFTHLKSFDQCKGIKVVDEQVSLGENSLYDVLLTFLEIYFKQTKQEKKP
jgi:hypothetical protein